jgi:hypothetical protein
MHADDQLICAKAVCADQVVIRMHIVTPVASHVEQHSRSRKKASLIKMTFLQASLMPRALTTLSTVQVERVKVTLSRMLRQPSIQVHSGTKNGMVALDHKYTASPMHTCQGAAKLDRPRGGSTNTQLRRKIHSLWI